MSRNTSLRILKLGGSLLMLGDLPNRLASWLEDQPPMQTGIIVGGGGIVDAMRDLDQRFSLDSPAMHWRCVKMLRYTTDIVAELMPNLDRLSDSVSLDGWLAKSDFSTTLIDTSAFYDENTLANLPKDWRTTTDSLAALLAIRSQAFELVLLKSCDLPSGLNWKQAAEQHLVDEAFHQFVDGIPSIQFVNLKALPVE